jgi:peptidoglycan hydrolase CwlO-like protein
VLSKERLDYNSNEKGASNLTLGPDVRLPPSSIPDSAAAATPILPNADSANQVLYQNLSNEIKELKILFLQFENNSNNANTSAAQLKNPLMSRKPSSALIEALRDVLTPGQTSARQSAGFPPGQVTPKPPLSPASAVENAIASRHLSRASLKSGASAPKAIPEEEKDQERESFLNLPSIKPSTPTTKIEDGIEEIPRKVEKDPNQLKHQLIQAEEKIVSLQSKQMSLEEELKSYQNYMRDIIPQYQKQIKALQHQQQKMKAAAVSNQGSSTLPSAKPAPSITAANIETGVEGDNQLKLPSIKP